MLLYSLLDPRDEAVAEGDREGCSAQRGVPGSEAPGSRPAPQLPRSRSIDCNPGILHPHTDGLSLKTLILYVRLSFISDFGLVGKFI